MTEEEQAVVPHQQETAPARVVLDQDRKDLLRRTILQDDVSDDELQLFVEVCHRTQLDPFMRQIYGFKSRGKLTFAATIDGLRLIAARTGEYQGQTAPMWCGPDGKWVDVWVKDEPPAAAAVGVRRAGFLEPAWGIATYKAYRQVNREGNPTEQWATNPANQLAKCAEALALRKAFPADMSGLYSEEEMGPPAEAGDEAPRQGGQRRQRSRGRQGQQQKQRSGPPPLTSDEFTRFWSEAKEAGVTKEQVKDRLEGTEPREASRSALLWVWTEFGNPPVDVESGEVIEGEAVEVPAELDGQEEASDG